MDRYGLLGNKVEYNNQMYFYVSNIQHVKLYVRNGEYIEYDGINVNIIGTIKDIEEHINQRRRTLTIRLP